MDNHYRIDSESLNALRFLSSAVFRSFRSPSVSVEYGDSRYLVSSISIRVDSRLFLVVECDCDETEEGLEYWELKVRLDNKPRGINALFDLTLNSWCFEDDHFWFNLADDSLVASVTILSATASSCDELLGYDAGIVVELVSGTIFSFVRDESFSGQMYISAGANDVGISRAPFTERLVE